MGKERTARNKVVRKQVREWLDTLPKGSTFIMREIASKYNKTARELSLIVREFDDVRISGRDYQGHDHVSVWEKL